MATVERWRLYVAVSMLFPWMESLVVNHDNHGDIGIDSGIDSAWDQIRYKAV